MTTPTACSITVTEEHISRGYAKGIHPVSLAVLDALPGFEDVDILVDRAICWVGVRSTDLLFDKAGQWIVSECDQRTAAGPFEFRAKAAA